MTRDLSPRWWRVAAAFALVLALVLLLVPQTQHGHASLLFVALAPVLWLFCIVITQQRHASIDEHTASLDLLLPLPSLSHLPPPDTLA